MQKARTNEIRNEAKDRKLGKKNILNFDFTET